MSLSSFINHWTFIANVENNLFDYDFILIFSLLNVQGALFSQSHLTIFFGRRFGSCPICIFGTCGDLDLKAVTFGYYSTSSICSNIYLSIFWSCVFCSICFLGIYLVHATCQYLLCLSLILHSKFHYCIIFAVTSCQIW